MFTVSYSLYLCIKLIKQWWILTKNNYDINYPIHSDCSLKKENYKNIRLFVCLHIGICLPPYVCPVLAEIYVFPSLLTSTIFVHNHFLGDSNNITHSLTYMLIFIQYDKRQFTLRVYFHVSPLICCKLVVRWKLISIRIIMTTPMYLLCLSNSLTLSSTWCCSPFSL